MSKNAELKSNIEQFEVFYNTLFQELCRYAYRFVFDNQVSEDIVQSFFVQLWEKSDEIEINTSRKAYAYQAVRNRAINYLKHKKFTDETLAALWEENIRLMPEGENDDPAFKQRVWQAIKKVPPKCRKILILNCVSGLRYNEIAEALNVSVNTVKTQVRIGYKIMRNELSDLFPFVMYLIFYFSYFF